MLNFLCRGKKGNLPGYSPILSDLLYARGVTDEKSADAFLHPSERDLTDPFRLWNMDKACQIIRGAVERKERIAVFGDYDCDGVCASVILSEALEAVGGEVTVYLPTRAEGYGLNENAVRELAKTCRLLITVDCGITGHNEIRLAREAGMQVIMTDHHTPQDGYPDADTVIHPLLSDLPEPAFCGAGVAYKLACALLGKKVLPSLELAGLATIADMVPLLGENRALAALGLEKIRTTARPGLKALLQAAGIREGASITGTNAGFQLAPRINACGRMDTARIAFDLLTAKDEDEARALAEKTNELNSRRKTLEDKIITEAIQQADQMDLCVSPVLVVDGEGWESGIMGIAAGQLADKYAYPTVVLRHDGDLLAGSGRSAGDIDLFAALNECKDLFARFGGHKSAAGLALPRENLAAFRERFGEAVKKQLNGRSPVPAVEYDGEISLSDINLDLIKSISLLEPFGMGNPEPVFLLRDTDVLQARPVGAKGSHMKLSVSQNGGSVVGGIAFRMGGLLGLTDTPCTLAATPVANEFNGRVNAEIRVSAIVPQKGAFPENLSASALTLLQEIKRTAAFEAEDIKTAPIPVSASLQGDLFICRTGKTANEMAERFPDLDNLTKPLPDPRAYSGIWLCEDAARIGPYKRVILCDGVLNSRETALWRSLYPDAEIIVSPRSAALQSVLSSLRFSLSDMRNFYRLLKSGEKVDLSVPVNRAMAETLAGMDLLAISPVFRLLPAQKTDAEQNPLFLLLSTGGD